MKSIQTRSGFTLVELMIVVVILGVLAAIAIPAFSRYVKRSKTSEAFTNLGAIVSGETTHFQQSANQTTAAFVSGDVTPSGTPSAAKFSPVAWTGGWTSVGFALDGASYYQYSASVNGTGSSSVFTADAVGNLDSDATNSTFRRVGAVNSEYEVVITTSAVTNELE